MKAFTKRTIALLLALAMVFAMTACRDNNTTVDEPQSNDSQTTPEQQVTDDEKEPDSSEGFTITDIKLEISYKEVSFFYVKLLD